MTLKKLFADLGFYSLENEAMRKYEAERGNRTQSPMFGPMPEYLEEKARKAREYEDSLKEYRKRRESPVTSLSASYNAPKGKSPEFSRDYDRSLTQRSFDRTATDCAAFSSAMSTMNIILS
jgi:hypothetical protein